MRLPPHGRAWRSLHAIRLGQGIVAVCIAFYAHAQVATHPAVTSTPTAVLTTQTDTHKAREQPFALVRANDSTGTGMTMSGPVSDIPISRPRASTSKATVIDEAIARHLATPAP